MSPVAYKLRGQGVMAPDWAEVINDLMAKGLSTKEIGDAMGQQLTDRMVMFYRIGSQPAYWRGKLLVELWCSTTGKGELEVPQAEVVRGHSVQRGRLAMLRAKLGRQAEQEQSSMLQKLTDCLKPKQREAKAPGRKKAATAE